MSERAAIYCRLSEEDRNKTLESEDSESIQNQKSMLLRFACEQGWDVCRIYSDDDYAGADRKRPEFNRLLKDAEKGEFEIILCKTQSRFTRELELVEKYLHGLFPLWGIRFVSVVDHADTENRGNKKSRQINGLVNEWYLEDMSESIRSVLVDKRLQGAHIGSFALYGYKKDPERKGHLLIDEEAACVVREVFTLFADGYGKTAIARLLNSRKIPNPTEYKRQKGLSYRQSGSANSTLWRYAAISDMLKNEMYIGNMVQGKYGSMSYKTKQNRPRPEDEWYRVEGTHEAVIERPLWERVQARLEEKAKPFSSGEIGLFAGKVRCAGCGYVMRSSKSRGRNYLKCPIRHIAKDACAGSFISVDALEDAVLDAFEKLAKQYLSQDAVNEASMRNSRGTEKKKKPDLAAAYQKEIAEYSRALCGLYMDKVKGVVSEDDYRLLAAELSTRRAALERQLASEMKRATAIGEADGTENPTDASQPSVERYKAPRHMNREMVETWIDYILVKKRLPRADAVEVEIHWNF